MKRPRVAGFGIDGSSHDRQGQAVRWTDRAWTVDAAFRRDPGGDLVGPAVHDAEK